VFDGGIAIVIVRAAELRVLQRERAIVTRQQTAAVSSDRGTRSQRREGERDR